MTNTKNFKELKEIAKGFVKKLSKKENRLEDEQGKIICSANHNNKFSAYDIKTISQIIANSTTHVINNNSKIKADIKPIATYYDNKNIGIIFEDYAQSSLFIYHTAQDSIKEHIDKCSENDVKKIKFEDLKAVRTQQDELDKLDKKIKK